MNNTLKTPYKNKENWMQVFSGDAAWFLRHNENGMKFYLYLDTQFLIHAYGNNFCLSLETTFNISENRSICMSGSN